jgi:hypothetical protein
LYNFWPYANLVPTWCQSRSWAILQKQNESWVKTSLFREMFVVERMIIVVGKFMSYSFSSRNRTSIHPLVQNGEEGQFNMPVPDVTTTVILRTGTADPIMKRLAKDESIPVMADLMMRMFKACEAARARLTMRACFARAGFTYHKVPDGNYILGFDKGMIRDSAEFREIWEMDFPLESLARGDAPLDVVFSMLNPSIPKGFGFTHCSQSLKETLLEEAAKGAQRPLIHELPVPS